MKKLCIVSTFVLAAGLAACGGDPANDPNPNPIDEPVDEPVDDPTPGDTLPPSLVSTFPAPDAVGVRSDASIIFTFSEAMDQDSVEGTLDVSELGNAVLSWNATGDTLTITPMDALEYAEGVGEDPSTVQAKRYVVTLGSAAKDLAGNPFGNGKQIIFYTLKAMGTTATPVHAMTRSLTPESLLFQNDDPLVVGDDNSDFGIRSTLSFDLSKIPSTAESILSAKIATRQTPNDNSGTPYADLGASVLLDHVMFSAMDSELEINAAFNSSQVAMASHEGFCVEDQIVIEFDVTEDVDADLDNRENLGDLSQYLMRFELPTDQDAKTDRAVFSRDLLELQVTYLAP